MQYPLDVVTFGEAMAMFVANKPGELQQIEQFSRKLAGAETNVAIGLTRLGFRVGWMSKLGRDPFGEYIMRTLNEEGVDIQSVHLEDHYSTGFQLKASTDDGSDPQVHYFRRFSAASTISMDSFDSSYYLRARHLHLTGIAPALSATCYQLAEHLLAQARDNGMTITFDPNLRPSLWDSETTMKNSINQLAIQSDWVLPGIQEGTLLTGFKEPADIAAYYLERGVTGVCVKLGAEGAYVRTHDEAFTVPGFKVLRVVDTVGAGDAFASGFISGLISDLSVKEAVSRANAMGAIAITSVGDSEGLPTLSELHSYMSNQGGKE
jgi:2-dehydro-3-deoxygluconokinase